MSQNRGLRYELLPDAEKYRLRQAKELPRKARYVDCDWLPWTAQQSAATHGCPGQ
jgi:hypothetical protein